MTLVPVHEIKNLLSLRLEVDIFNVFSFGRDKRVQFKMYIDELVCLCHKKGLHLIHWYDEPNRVSVYEVRREREKNG